MSVRMLVTLAVGAGLAVGACSSSAKSSTATPTVGLADNPKYGKILVAPDGHTLYLFEKETGLTSACTGGCAGVWPALKASGSPTGAAGVNAAMLSTANGQVPNQVAYNSHLLYEFSGDKATGDVNGTSIPQWYPVGPDGNKIDKS